MKRLHLHLSVADLELSVRFYSGLFAAQPTVMKDDYAKWMLDDPHVNFAISKRSADTGLNHLGIQVESGQELEEMHTRLTALQSDVQKEEAVACCYAKSDKYWVQDPSGLAWEAFQTLDTIPVFGDADPAPVSTDACCVPLAPVSRAPQSAASCCVPLQTHRSSSEQCC